MRYTVPLLPSPDGVERDGQAVGNLLVAPRSLDDLCMISHNAYNAQCIIPRKCLLHHRVDYLPFMGGASSRLKTARQRSGYGSAKAAAEAMGVPVATYIQHENGGRGLPASRAERYARFFRVKPEWLLYGKDTGDRVIELGPRLFVVGEVAAGVFKEAWKNPEDEWEAFTGRPDVQVPLTDRFGLFVTGDSMDDPYPPGTILECVNYYGQEVIPSGKHQAFRGDLPGPGISRVEIIATVIASIRPE